MKNTLFKLFVGIAACFTLVSCNTSSSRSEFNSVIVICQGTMGSNGSVTQYNTKTNVSVVDFYEKINKGTSLGKLPMSLYVYDANCWVPVDGNIMVFDPISGYYISRVPNLHKPAFINFVALNKAFVSDVEEPSITVFNPITTNFVDTIHLSSPAGNMQFIDRFMYTNQWSYGKQILQIDPMNNTVVDSLEVGVQPNTLKVDRYNYIWTITDGGWDGNPVGNVDPAIVKIKVVGGMEIKSRWTLPKGPNYQLSLSAMLTNVFYTAGDKVYRFSIDAKELPTTPIIEIQGANLSAVVEDPFTGDLYVADAVDYVSAGKVYRYNKDLKLIDTFTTGPNPMSFCFVQ